MAAGEAWADSLAHAFDDEAHAKTMLCCTVAMSDAVFAITQSKEERICKL